MRHGGPRNHLQDDGVAELERLQRLLNALPAIAWSASAVTFRFTYVNPAAEKILGYPVERWLEEPDFWTSHIHPDDIYVAKLCHNETLACRDHELMYRMIAADGRHVWLRDRINVHTIDGKPVELFGIMIDVTRERIAEQASTESRENFRRMVDLSPDCIGVHVDGRYVYVNHAFVELLGARNESEIVGRDALSLVDEPHRASVRERIARVALGETVPYIRQKYRRVDGRLVDVEIAKLPLRYGNRRAVQVIARDVTDRVRAEEELRSRETRLQLLAAGTHEAIWEWSPERNEVWTNLAYRQMLGEPQDAGTFLEEWLERIHPDDRENAREVSRRVVEEAPPAWAFEYRLQDRDGNYRVVLDRGHTVRSPNGERRMIGALLDVTPMREAERLRASAEAKFRWIVEQSVVGVYMTSGGLLTYINSTGAKMLGYSTGELSEIDLSALLHEDEPAGAILAQGASIARIRRKDGVTLYVGFYQNEVTFDGEPMTVGTFTDVTESVRARHALEVSEQRYRELVEDVSDILFTLDSEGRFESLSHSFERSTGYHVDDWIGRPFRDLFHGGDDLSMVDDGGRTIREYQLASYGGDVVILEVLSQPRWVGGIRAGTIGTARDVTERRSIARKLEEAKRMTVLGQVAASLAHEFNNVLMGIQPFVELIGRHAPGIQGVTDALGHITRAIHRGKRASQEILRFANPKEPQLFPIEVRLWLPPLLTQWSALLPPSIHLTSSIEPDAGFLRGDATQLEQVITNLVLNARDATVGEGTIHIGVSRQHEMVRISICDSGPGIPPEMRAKIFEPLYTTKRNGTGLGLAIARRLVEAHAGTLTVDNRVEGGAAFHVLVPADHSPEELAQEHDWASPAIHRILLVEDDAAVGSGLELLLKAEGYDTMWVRAAADVCAAARQIRPHVAIIDVNLPDGNGAELVPLLRAEHKDLPIVLSTGHVELQVAEGEKHILSLMKPYELTDLLAAITAVTAAA